MATTPAAVRADGGAGSARIGSSRSAATARLRTIGEVFPHAARVSRSVDIDHPAEYGEHGPPGRTGDHNAAPVSRTHHRHVDDQGTHVIDAAAARDLERTAAIERALDTFAAGLGRAG